MIISKIHSIIFNPRKTISAIVDEEPVFYGIFIFIVSVIIGNINWVSKFFIRWQTGVIYSFSLILLWAGLMIVIDLILTMFLKLINPTSSNVLNMERFRKLVIVQMNISAILLFKPVLDIFLSCKMSWIVLFVWAVILVLIAITCLWEITEIKAAVSASVAVISIFIFIKVIRLPNEYVFSKDFKKLENMVIENCIAEEMGLLQISGQGSCGREKIFKLINEIERFAVDNRDSVTVPYCNLIKSRLMLAEGMSKEAIEQLKRIAASEKLQLNAYKTSILKLFELIPEKEFEMLPLDNSADKWRKILEFWNIPADLSNYKDDAIRAARVKNRIDNGKLNIIEKNIANIVNNFFNSYFIDDIYFWLAEKYEKNKKYEEAIKYYEKSHEVSKLNEQDSNRMKIESMMNSIEEYVGISILEERVRGPYAIFRTAKIYERIGKQKEGMLLYSKLLNEYYDHSLSANAVIELAYNSEKNGRYKEAVSYYNQLVRLHPRSRAAVGILLKKNIIEKTITKKTILSIYNSGWKKWRNRKYEEAIVIFKDIIENYPTTDMAHELQYGIVLYYRITGEYVRAMRECKTGYKRLKNTSRRFDFGWQMGKILADDLSYYKRAIEWYEAVKEDHPLNYTAPVSKRTINGISLEIAALYKDKLKNYKKAKQIYSDIAKISSKPEIIAEALYESAVIDETIFRKYKQAASCYSTIIEKYRNTCWKKMASQRLNSIRKNKPKVMGRNF